MRVEELKNMLERAVKAQKDAFEEMLQSNSEEVMKKYENCAKMVADLEAQVEKAESNGKVPAPKATDLTESQRWTAKFIEAVTTSGNFSGGMPREMASEVIKKAAAYAKLRGICRVFSTSSDLSITVESGLPTVAYVTEGGVLGETNPATAPVVLNAYKLACIVKINRELCKDLSFDVVAYVEDALARAFALKEDAEILLGTGTNAVEGVTVKSGVNTKAAASATTVTWAEVKACATAVGAYRQGPSCAWVMSQAIADAIHDFKDGSGNYIFPQNEELKRIMGYPVLISEAMPTPAASQPLVVFGNFDYYALGERENIDLTVLNELYAGNDQVGVKAVERLDGKVLQAKAFSVITGKA